MFCFPVAIPRATAASQLLSPPCLGSHGSATRAPARRGCERSAGGDTWGGRTHGREEMRNRGRRRYPGSWKRPQKFPATDRFAAAKRGPLLPPGRAWGCFSCPSPSRLRARGAADPHPASPRMQGGCACCQKLCSWAEVVAPCLAWAQQRSQQQWGSSALGCREGSVCLLEKHYPSIPFRARARQHRAFHQAGRFA